MLREQATQSPNLASTGPLARQRPSISIDGNGGGSGLAGLSPSRVSRLSRQSVASNGRNSTTLKNDISAEHAVAVATVKKAKYLGAAAQEAAKRTIKEEVAPAPGPAVLKAQAAYNLAQSQAHAVYLRKLEEQPDLAKAARREQIA